MFACDRVSVCVRVCVHTHTMLQRGLFILGMLFDSHEVILKFFFFLSEKEIGIDLSY